MMPDQTGHPSSHIPVVTVLGPSVALLAVFLLVYGFDCGTGFISDDFAWVLHSRWDGPGAIANAFSSAEGFYRPLVSLSFGINHELFGLSPRGYGWTNLGLVLACAASLAALARQLRWSWGLAVTAAGLWLFNFHGINMAVLWLSGRTSLLVTLFSLLAAVAFLRERPIPTAIATAAALLSKEEAVVLPALFATWAIAIRVAHARGRWRELPAPPLRAVVAVWIALPVYFVLRASTGAFWFSSAPSFYQPSFDLARIAQNVMQYADRALTTPALAVLLAWLFVRQRPVISDRTRVTAVLGLSWLLLGYAITVFLPVRSSLYAVLPSAGGVLLAASVIGDLVERLPVANQRRLAWSAVGLLLLLVPVYWSRNVRWTELGALSASVVSQLRTRQPDLPGSVVIVDDGETRANLANAWGQLVPEMVQLVFDGRLDVTVRPAGTVEAPEPGRVVLRLRNGQLEP